jgi:pimeloyl-ACP methyl ester carboxylesterase
VNSGQKIFPFYFRLSDKPLFGCYHEPAPGRLRQCGVLVCQPVGHEYVNSHRALRQLAVRLSEAGFPVLRFDYYGCGDSSGNTEDASMLQWMQDVSAALSELRGHSGLFQVCVVGLRLGGTLATLVAAERRGIESMVLWDPVVDGRRYLEELRSLQKDMLRFRPKQRCDQKASFHTEILGFPFSRHLITEIESVNLMRIARKFTRNMLIVQTSPLNSDKRSGDCLGSSATNFECQRVEAPQIWLPAEDGSLLVPAQVLQAVVTWNCGIYS